MSRMPSAELWRAVALRSTEASSDVTAFVGWMDREAEIAAARALRGPRNALAGSEKVRAGIRLAIGARPANGLRPTVRAVLDWIATKGPEYFGLERIPDDATVAAVIDEMEAQWKATLLSRDVTGWRCEPSTIATTR